MPYYIELPDGRYAQFGDDVEPEAARRQIFDAFPEYFSVEQQRAYQQQAIQEETSALGRGFMSALETTTGNLGALGRYLTGGDFDTFQADIEATEKAAQEKNPVPVTFGQVRRAFSDDFLKGLGTLSSYLGELGGGAGPYMLGTLGGGAAGAVTGGPPGAFVGATAGGFPQFFAENVVRQVQEGAESEEDIDWLAAATAGGGQAALNTLGFVVGGFFGRAAQGAVIRQLFDRAAAIPGGRYAAAGIATSQVEGFTEVAQNALERMQAGLEPFEEGETLESYAGGALLGFLLGPVGAGVSQTGITDRGPSVPPAAAPETPPEAAGAQEVLQALEDAPLALPAPTGPSGVPVFDIRPEPDETPATYAERAIRTAAADFPEGPYTVAFQDPGYQVVSQDGAPVGAPFRSATDAQEVANTYNARQDEISSERGVQEALQRTRQEETAALLAAARETTAPLGTFTIDEVGPDIAGRVNMWRMPRGLDALNDFTIEDMADARVPQAQIDDLIRRRRPTTSTVIEADDVRALAKEKNIAANDENFRVFARRVTGTGNLDRMNQTQLSALQESLSALPANEAPVTMPVVEREQFSGDQYRAAVDALQEQGRYSQQALRSSTGLTRDEDLKALRKALVRRGELVERRPGEFRLADVLPAERQTLPGDLPAGVTRRHTIRELPIEQVRVRKNGKSIGTFHDPAEARAQVSTIRAQETEKGADPAEITMEPVEETGFGVFENRYNADGDYLGEALVDSYRNRAQAEQEARQRDGVPEQPRRKPPPPEALQGRLTAVTDALEGFARDRKLQTLGANVRLVKEIPGVPGARIAGVTVPTDSGTQLIRIATDHLTPDMTLDEVIENLGATLDHETIHALRNAGVLPSGGKEWNALDRYVRRNKHGETGETFYQYANRVYRGRPGYETEERVVEEAIAEAFRAWAAERRSVQPPAAGIFRKIAQWFKNLVNRLPNEIFRAIETGTLPEQEIDAARARAAMSAPPGTMPTYSLEAPLGARVPPVTNNREFDIVHQRVEGAIGEFLFNLGRSKKRIPGLNASIFEIRIKAQDKMLSVKEMLEVIKDSGGQVTDLTDPYLIEQLYHGRVVERIEKREQDLYLPLMNAIQNSPRVSLKDVEDYLYARHAPERNAELRAAGSEAVDPSGMSDAEAAEIMNQMRIDGKLPELERIAGMADAITANTTQTRIDGGLLSGEQAAASPYQNYMPLRGFAQEDLDPELPFEENMRARSGRGFSVAGREDLRPTGRDRKAGDILGHLFLQNEEAVIRAEKNRVAQSLMGLIEANPGTGFGEILQGVPTRRTRGSDGRVRNTTDLSYRQRPDIVVAKVDGREVVMQVEDPRVARAVKMDYPSTSGPFINILGKFNRFLATINTAWSPEFVVSNFARDLQTAGILAQQYDVPGLTRNIVKDIPGALRGIRAVLREGDTSDRWSKAFMDLREDGGTTEFLGIRDLESQIAKIRGDLGAVNAPRFRKGRQILSSVAKFAEDYNKVVENGARLAAYVNARNAGVSREQAAFLAKNLTVNFNKGGEWKSLMNSMYLFYNASLQGTMVMMNGLRSKRVQKIVGGIVAAGAVQDMTNRLMSGDEDNNGILDYDEIPDYVLEHNLVLMDPLGIMGSNKYLAIPMPYGFNAFYNTGRNMSAVLGGSTRWTPMKAATSIASSFVNSFNPLGGTESFLNFVSPTIVDPIVDLYENRDFAGRAIVPERPGFGVPTPQSQLYWNSTAEPFKWVTEQLNALTGGNAVRAGMIDISPEVLEHAYDYALGSLGAFVMRTGNAAAQGLSGDLDEIEIGQIPFIRRVVGSVTERANQETYYRNSEEVLLVDKEREFFRDIGNFDALRALMRDRRDQIRYIPLFKKADKDLQKLRRQLKEVEENERMSAETKQRLKRQYRDRMDTIMRTVNRVYLRE